MRSQFIVIFILLISLGLIYFFFNIGEIPSYPYDTSKYIIEDFRIKLLLYDPELVNKTYYTLCMENGVLCYYNGTHIVYSDKFRNISLVVS